MLRHTLSKHKTRNLPKATITQNKSQRGGAAWTMIHADRQGNWRAELDYQGKMDLFGTLLQDRNEMDTRRVANMTQYISMIKQQDDLFDVAMGAMCRAIEARLPAGSNIMLGDYESIHEVAVQIDGMRDEMLEYIKDVERLIAFGLDPIDPANAQNKTKLQLIYMNPSETLSSLLLFPWRITNVFVLGLARILTTLRRDDSILQEINGQASLQALLANQWESYVKAEASRLTAKDLRDGFYMNQGVVEFKEYVELFWPELVTDMTSGVNMFADPEECKNLMQQANGSEVSYARIVASLYATYKAGGLDTLLQAFARCGSTGHVDTVDDAHLPNKSEWNLAFDGVTLKQLLEQMDDTTLQFILHLAYTIQKVENEPPAYVPYGPSGTGPGSSGADADAEIARLRARIAQLEKDCIEGPRTTIAERNAQIAERNTQIAQKNSQIAQLQAAVQPSAPPEEINASGTVNASAGLPTGVNASGSAPLVSGSASASGSINASGSAPLVSGSVNGLSGSVTAPLVSGSVNASGSLNGLNGSTSMQITPPPSPPLASNGTGPALPNLSLAETTAKEKMEAAKAKLKEKFGSLTGLTHPKNVEAAAASLEDKSKLAANILRNKGEIPEGATHEEVEAAAAAINEEHIKEASGAVRADRTQAIINSGDQELIDKYTKPKKVAGRNVAPNAPPRILTAEEKAKANAKKAEEEAAQPAPARGAPSFMEIMRESTEKRKKSIATLKSKLGSLARLEDPVLIEDAAKILEKSSPLVASMLRNKLNVPDGTSHDTLDAAIASLTVAHVDEAIAAVAAAEKAKTNAAAAKKAEEEAKANAAIQKNAGAQLNPFASPSEKKALTAAAAKKAAANAAEEAREKAAAEEAKEKAAEEETEEASRKKAAAKLQADRAASAKRVRRGSIGRKRGGSRTTKRKERQRS